jgi:hypothetical protein
MGPIPELPGVILQLDGDRVVLFCADNHVFLDVEEHLVSVCDLPYDWGHIGGDNPSRYRMTFPAGTTIDDVTRALSTFDRSKLKRAWAKDSN